MKILVDKEKCFMSGECYYNHPELFKMDSEGYPEAIKNPLTEELVKHAEEAIEVCPAVALRLEN